MKIEDILTKEREIWGNEKQSVEHILACLTVMIGDVARQVRAKHEDVEINQVELEKEIGNIITSTIRWADDLGLNLDTAITTALDSQKAYAKKPR